MASIYEWARSDEPSDIAAERFVAGLDDDQRQGLLLRFVKDEIASIRRDDALRAERRAQRNPNAARESRERKEWLAARAAERIARGYGADVWGGLAMAMDGLREAVRLEVTSELLATSFALPDGRLVTWGTAIVSDHEARRDALLGHALATAETGLRHQRAIEMLLESGAQTLGDLDATRRAAA